MAKSARSSRGESQPSSDNDDTDELRGALVNLTNLVSEILTVLKAAAPAACSGKPQATAQTMAPVGSDEEDDAEKLAAPVVRRGRPTKAEQAAKLAAQQSADDDAPPPRSQRRAAASAVVLEIAEPPEDLLQLVSQIGSPASRKQLAAEDSVLSSFDVDLPDDAGVLVGDIFIDDSQDNVIAVKLAIAEEVPSKKDPKKMVLRTVAELDTFVEWTTPLRFSYEDKTYELNAPE